MPWHAQYLWWTGRRRNLSSLHTTAGAHNVWAASTTPPPHQPRAVRRPPRTSSAHVTHHPAVGRAANESKATGHRPQKRGAAASGPHYIRWTLLVYGRYGGGRSMAREDKRKKKEKKPSCIIALEATGRGRGGAGRPAGRLAHAGCPPPPRCDLQHTKPGTDGDQHDEQEHATCHHTMFRQPSVSQACLCPALPLCGHARRRRWLCAEALLLERERSRPRRPRSIRRRQGGVRCEAS